MPSHLWTLLPDVAYLNHGSFGACPRGVIEFQQSLRDEMEREPVQFLWRRLPERIDDARRELAGFLNASPASLAFIPNATTAVNAIIRSFNWREGDEILTTDHAYNACRNVLDEAAKDHKLQVAVATLPFPLKSDDEILEAILSAVTPRTRVALIDHVTSPTALILPIARIIRELESRGIETLVDGAHAPGFLPLDLSELQPAWYTGNLHKWVCAPKGAAFLYVREDLQPGLLPTTISHGYNTPRPGSSRFHDLFDWPGTNDPTAWLSVPEAIRLLGSILPSGWDGVRRANHELLIQARRKLCESLSLAPPCPESMLGSMATLPLPGKLAEIPATLPDPLQLELYDTHRIEVPLPRFGGRRWFRISAQLYNTPADYERLTTALTGFL